MYPVEIIETCLHFDELVKSSITNKIIIHHSATQDISAADIHRMHLSIGYCGIGYHFVVRDNGAIERGRPIWAVGAHTFGENLNSVGICLAGNFNINLPSHFQLESAALLIAYLCKHFDLPCDNQHIFPHRHFCQTACPGDFLFDDFQSLIGKANWYLK